MPISLNLISGMLNKIHLKGLNGLRAIAAIVLLWGHTSQDCFAMWGKDISITLPVCCAYVFFVISGFLAGYKPSVNVPIATYYKKKAKRILPLYYLYLLFAILAFVIMGRCDDVFNLNLLFYIIPIPNIPFSGCGTAILPLVHLWFIGSLILFYLLFPLIERLCGKNLLKTSAAIAICWILLKIAIYVFVGKGTFIYKYCGTLGVDCLYGGVALGILVRDENVWIDKIKESSLASMSAWLLFLTSGLYQNYVPSVIRVDYIAILTGVLILSQLTEKPFINLDNKIFDWIGDVSYEIYVFQILLLILMSTMYNYLCISLPTVVIYLLTTTMVIIVAWGANEICKTITKTI